MGIKSEWWKIEKESVSFVEKFDIYNAEKTFSSRTGIRGIPLKSGDFRFVVRVIIFNSAGDKILVQQRVKSKSAFPEKWDFSAAGGVLAGESLAEAASRELFEELGVQADFSDVPSRMTVRFHEGWSEIFLLQKDVKIEDLHLQKSEVAAVKWVSEKELHHMIDKGLFIPFIYAKSIFDYLRFGGETKQS